MADLRDCPFCGGDAKRFDIDEGENAGGSCIACTRCLASGNVEFGRKENFVSNWNRRADTQAADEIARLREALVDLVSWFDGGPSSYGPWIIKAGEFGADDAVHAARAALQHKEPQG